MFLFRRSENVNVQDVLRKEIHAHFVQQLVHHYLGGFLLLLAFVFTLLTPYRLKKRISDMRFMWNDENENRTALEIFCVLLAWSVYDFFGTHSAK